MKPKIIKADTAGMIVSWDNGNDVYYVGDTCPPIGNGVAYKDRAAFDSLQGICYIPEAGFFDEVGINENVSDEMLAWMRKNNEWYVLCDEGYTYDDLFHEFQKHLGDWYDEQVAKYGESFLDGFIDKEIAYIFGELDWQCPQTFINEMDWYEDWLDYVKEYDNDPRLTDKQKKELGYD